MIKYTFSLIVMTFATILVAQNIEFVKVQSGSFSMGSETAVAKSDIPGDKYHNLNYLKNGDFDEFPVHVVQLTYNFEISKGEITAELFKQFDPSYEVTTGQEPVRGISWNDAVAFCEWLSAKEGVTYRLPTEAEWEYVAKLVKQQDLSVDGMFSYPAEWCMDWYDFYGPDTLVDPAGPETGLTKVIRGGGLDKTGAFFFRPSNRASAGPGFPEVRNNVYQESIAEQLVKDSMEAAKMEMTEDDLEKEDRYLNFAKTGTNNQGNHFIGFRIVKVKAETQFTEATRIFPTELVKAHGVFDTISRTEPYYRKRYVLPTPSDDSEDSLIPFFTGLGLDAGILSHNHSPALEVMPNGDVVMVIYTSVSETTHDVKLLITRLRRGADAWDKPQVLINMADANDHAPMLWQEGDTTRLYWGNNKYDGGYPFNWIESYDYGHTWTTPKYPNFSTPVYAHSAQPITSAFRDENGFIYVASDGYGSASVLWRSEDNGQTWIDPKGRTPGRHSAVVLLNDGRILAMGGKSSQIGGHMPKAISSDMGVSWEYEASPFIAQGPGQRPSITRLKSGTLVMVGDFSSRLSDELASNRPKEFTERGCYVAYSKDEGETWVIKRLPGTQFANFKGDKLLDHTLGYSVVKQGPDENIHILATVVHPVQHYEFNERWLYSEIQMTDDETLDEPSVKVFKRKTVEEMYNDSSVMAKYTFAMNMDFSVKLDGTEEWFYPNGQLMYSVTYVQGVKTGLESFYKEDGTLLWQNEYMAEGIVIKKNFYSNGQLMNESRWKGKFAEGEMKVYDKSGLVVQTAHFSNGKLVK